MIPGAHDPAPDELLSCQQVAERLGISLAHVRLLARSRDIGRALGKDDFLFTPVDLAALRPRRPGRPWAERDIPWIELA
jgi:hypothetical protein